MSIDYNRAFMLFSIVEKSVAHPRYAAISNLAAVELDHMAQIAAKDLAKIQADAKAKAEEEAAKKAAEAKAVADKVAAEEKAQAKKAEEEANKPHLDPTPPGAIGAQASTESDVARRL